MGRTPNIKINGELLDKKIKDAEGAKFNMTKISTFVCGKDKTYYRKSVLKNNVSTEVLDRICEFYDFNKEDFIITEEVETKMIQEKADTQNYENVILLLQGIDKTLKELLAQQKSTNYILGELSNKATTDNRNGKELLQKLETLEKRQSRYGKYN